MSILLVAPVAVSEAPVVNQADYFQVTGFRYTDNFNTKSFDIDCSIGKASYGDPLQSIYGLVTVGSALGDTLTFVDPALSAVDGFYVNDYITVTNPSTSLAYNVKKKVLAYNGTTKAFTVEPFGQLISIGDQVRLDYITRKTVQTGVTWVKTWQVKLTPTQMLAVMGQLTTGGSFFNEIKTALYQFLTANGHIPTGF